MYVYIYKCTHTHIYRYTLIETKLIRRLFAYIAWQTINIKSNATKPCEGPISPIHDKSSCLHINNMGMQCPRNETFHFYMFYIHLFDLPLETP